MMARTCRTRANDKSGLQTKAKGHAYDPNNAAAWSNYMLFFIKSRPLAFGSQTPGSWRPPLLGVPQRGGHERTVCVLSTSTGTLTPLKLYLSRRFDPPKMALACQKLQSKPRHTDYLCNLYSSWANLPYPAKIKPRFALGLSFNPGSPLCLTLPSHRPLASEISALFCSRPPATR